MPSGRATVWSSYLKISRKRNLSSLILELRVLDLLCIIIIFWLWTWVVFPLIYVFSFLYTGIYGGFLLGVRSVNGLAFYDWENTELIRRIEIQPKHVQWPIWLVQFNPPQKSTFFIDNYCYVFRSSGQTPVSWSASLQRSPSSSCVTWQRK